MAKITILTCINSYLLNTASLHVYALEKFHLDWQDGGACTLLGASG